MDGREEGRLLLSVLARCLAAEWDGKACVLELKEADYNWRQMEWIGWYFEWKGRVVLVANVGGGEGPRFGRTKIDYMRLHPWDLKAHPASGDDKWAILNDVEAVNACVERHQGIGFLVAVGIAGYDDPDTREFQKWHVMESGGKSAYTTKREREGRPSRLRKRSFKVDELMGFYFRDRGEVERALREGWLKDTFQKGMRNSDGSPRRAKYAVRLRDVDPWAKL